MTPDLKAAERERIAADVARFTGTITVVPPGVSGDDYIARMNAHWRSASDWDRSRLRGAVEGNAAQWKVGKKRKKAAK